MGEDGNDEGIEQEDGDVGDENGEYEDVKDEEVALGLSKQTIFAWFMSRIADGQVSSRTEGVYQVLLLLVRSGANLQMWGYFLCSCSMTRGNYHQNNYFPSCFSV